MRITSRFEGSRSTEATQGGIVGNGIHHVKVLDNIAHDNASNGILLMKSDFITVDGNVTYDNASRRSPVGHLDLPPGEYHWSKSTTGTGSSSATTSRYSNKNKSRCAHRRQRIIFDDFNSTQVTGSFRAYKFASLIENNIVYQNGGRRHHGVQQRQRHGPRQHRLSQQPRQQEQQYRGAPSSRIRKSDNITWIDNVAVADKTVNKNNTAIGNFSFSGDKNTEHGVERQHHVQRQERRRLGQHGVGNTAPSASEQRSGQEPRAVAVERQVDGREARRRDGVRVGREGRRREPDLRGRRRHRNRHRHRRQQDRGLAKWRPPAATSSTGGAGDDKLDGKAGADKLYGGPATTS